MQKRALAQKAREAPPRTRPQQRLTNVAHTAITLRQCAPATPRNTQKPPCHTSSRAPPPTAADGDGADGETAAAAGGQGVAVRRTAGGPSAALAEAAADIPPTLHEPSAIERIVSRSR
eukprot:4252301-Prymnesium_polylepis.1